MAEGSENDNTQPDDRGESEALDRHPDSMTDVGDAAWAHNRWPTIGLYAGAGIGAFLGLVFYAGWFWTILYIVVLAIVGGVLGFVAAKLMYP